MRCFSLFFVLLALAAGMVSCQKAGQDVPEAEDPSGKTFYATIDNDLDSKVYADEELRVLWDADDRISIFDHYTLNEEFRFTGESGANAGWFERVPLDGFVTGNELDYVYAVYPYREGTTIDNDGVLKVDLPEKQTYRKDSFGLGANTMLSVTKDNRLHFRNACGYLVLKLYGLGVSVSSITLQGSFSEPISGKAFLSMTPEGVPALKPAEEASSIVTLLCEKPVELPGNPEQAVEFWFAVSPVVFEHGFTAIVESTDGRTFTPFTKKAVEVPRNRKVSMAPFDLGTHAGEVTVDKNPVCNLAYARGKDADGEQKWEFSDGKDIVVQVESWRCRCVTLDHIGYHVSHVHLGIPGYDLSIPLERTVGDDYISSNKAVAGAHLNKYQISNNGTWLDFDISITLYRETGGDIRIVYAGPVL